MFHDVSSILFCFFKACTCFPTISTLEHPKTTSTKVFQVPSTTLSVTSPRWAEPADHCVSLWANGLDLNLSHHPHHPHWRGGVRFKPWWSICDHRKIGPPLWPSSLSCFQPPQSSLFLEILWRNLEMHLQLKKNRIRPSPGLPFHSLHLPAQTGRKTAQHP